MATDKVLVGASAPPNVPNSMEVPPEVAFRQAMANPMVPKIYANMFFNYLGPNDLSIMLGNGSVPSGVLSLSYSTAKTLAKLLQQAVQQWEDAAGVVLPPTEIVEAKFTEAGARR